MGKNGRKGIVYFYEEKNRVTLYNACKNILNISYNDVTRSIRYYLKTYSNKYNLCDLIQLVVDRYLILAKRKIQSTIINKLLNNEKVNIYEAANILEINYKRIFELKKYNYRTNISILTIYFVGDILSDKKSITKKKLFLIADNKYREKTILINELIYFYYLNNSSLILERIVTIYESKFVSWIYRVANLFFIKLNSWDLEDIKFILYEKLFYLLNGHKIISNMPNQINSFIYKTMNGIIYQEILKIKNSYRDLHLEEKVDETRTLLDVLPSY